MELPTATQKPEVVIRKVTNQIQVVTNSMVSRILVAFITPMAIIQKAIITQKLKVIESMVFQIRAVLIIKFMFIITLALTLMGCQRQEVLIFMIKLQKLEVLVFIKLIIKLIIMVTIIKEV